MQKTDDLSGQSMLDVLAIYALWLSAVFDPVGFVFGLRYIALGLVGLALMSKVMAGKSFSLPWPYAYIFAFFSIFLPLYGLIIGLLRGGVGGRDFIDTSYFNGAVYFACSLLYFSAGNLAVALKAQVFALRCLCLVILSCLLVVLFGSNLDWIYVFVSNGVALYGVRNYGGIEFQFIYFVASPMIVFLLIYESWQFFDRPSITSSLLLCLPIFALFLSGTRANILISILGVSLVFLWRRYHFWSLLYLSLIGVGGLTVVSFLNQSVLIDMFSFQDESNAEKIGYLRNYAELFSEPLTLLIGQGFNAQEWSRDFANMLTGEASKTELTYFEILRVFGLPGVIGFFGVLYFLFSGAMHSVKYEWIAPASLLYLMMSSLNPYMFSSNGMLLFGFAAVAISQKCSSIQVATAK